MAFSGRVLMSAAIRGVHTDHNLAHCIVLRILRDILQKQIDDFKESLNILNFSNNVSEL